METPKNVDFVVKRYAARKAKIRPYAGVKWSSMYMYMLRKGEEGLPSFGL